MAASMVPCATLARRSASDGMRGTMLAGGSNAGSFSRKFFGPAMRVPLNASPGETVMAAPLRVAPPPATAKKNSSLTAANRHAATGRPLSTRAAETTHSGRPAIYARVPSIGSTIQTKRAASRAGSSTLSSDSQPAPGSPSLKRSRNSLSTAMSASETGDEAPLVQFFSGVPNRESASAPASRTDAARRSAARVRSTPSVACNRQALQAHGRRVRPVTECQIVRWFEASEHFQELAGDRDFAHRISQFAILDPETGGAAAIIARHHVDTHADQAGDKEAILDFADQLLGGFAAGRQMQIGRSRRRCR